MAFMILLGMMVITTLGFVLAGGFYVQAWRHRRDSKEHLFFGIATLCLAVHSGSIGSGYFHLLLHGNGSDISTYAAVSAVSGVFGMIGLIHFGLTYTRNERTTAILTGSYLVAAVFVAAIVSQQWWDLSATRIEEDHFLGHAYPAVRMAPHGLAMLFYALAPLAIAGVAYLLWRGREPEAPRSWLSGIAAIAVVGATANDALAIGAGLYRSISLLPIGYGVFCFAVSLTLVSRYGQLATALERRTHELHERSEELASSMTTLAATEDVLLLKRQLAVVGELIEVMANEIRSPVADANDALAALRRGESAANEPELLRVIDHQMSNVEHLVGELLQFARPISLNVDPLDLQDLLGSSLQSAGEYHDVVLSHARDTPIELVGDRSHLRNAFQQIVRNALQAMAYQGRLRVSVRELVRDGLASVAIAFEDSGEGMTQQQQAQALAPFFTTRPGGSGLGLPICQRIIEAHHGRIDVSSVVDEGTCVTVVLPLAPPDDGPPPLLAGSGTAG